jgi:hypothetical protein
MNRQLLDCELQMQLYRRAGDVQKAFAAIGWPGLLEVAASTEEVVSLAKDFLAAWSPEEIAALPVECQPRRLIDGDDVTFYAFDLVKHQCDQRRNARVGKMAAFFSSASLRLSQIMARAARSSPRN